MAISTRPPPCNSVILQGQGLAEPRVCIITTLLQKQALARTSSKAIPVHHTP